VGTFVERFTIRGWPAGATGSRSDEEAAAAAILIEG
jgi:hypothetical protein